MDFEAPKEPRYLKLKGGQGVNVEFLDRDPDAHAEFKLGDAAAPIYHILADGEPAKLTVTSTQLAKTLAAVKAHYGALHGRVLRIYANGDGTDRTYRVSGPDAKNSSLAGL